MSQTSSQKDSANFDENAPLVNLRKQAKYAIVGGIGVWYWQVSLHLTDVLSGSGWSKLLALISITLYSITVVTFAYLMLLPARGIYVNYGRWQKDPHLQSLIPLMTGCIVIGFGTLVLTLSPICAPSPPSAALSQRLLEAANVAGGNLQKATSGIQALLADTARSIGINTGSSGFGSDLDVSSLLRALRLPDAEALAIRLGVRKDRTNLLISTLDKYQSRAQAWKENNVKVLGWTGAFIGSISAFTLMFGVVGLFGLLTPGTKKSKKRHTL